MEDDDGVIVCVPGTWENRSQFLDAVMTSTRGDFMFAGRLLSDMKENDHVEVEFYGPEVHAEWKFERGGQGKLTELTLGKIAQHKSIVFLETPFDIVTQKERLLKFTKVLADCGGIAIKLETSGVAHEWDRWFELLGSANLWDIYCASVILIWDDEYYYSCGMHNFGLPDVQILKSLDVEDPADLMNQFNYWQIVEKPIMKTGHTFSLTPDSQYYRLKLLEEDRYTEVKGFHNLNGLWELREL